MSNKLRDRWEFSQDFVGLKRYRLKESGMRKIAPIYYIASMDIYDGSGQKKRQATTTRYASVTTMPLYMLLSHIKTP